MPALTAADKEALAAASATVARLTKKLTAKPKTKAASTTAKAPAKKKGAAKK